MFKVQEKNRLKNPPNGLISNELYGNNGCFIFSFECYEIFCIASDGLGWEHVSVTINRKRTPSWEIMQFVKEQFWDDEDVVIQIHPKKSEYVNNHLYCLHLWRPKGTNIQTPNNIMV